MVPPLDGHESDDEATGQEPHRESHAEQAATVLEVFGVSLKVSNPRLAEILTMDAKAALTSDVRDFTDVSGMKTTREETAQAMPDVVVSQPTPHDDEDARLRTEMRQLVSGLGSALGFDVQPNGSWISPTGFTLLTRSVHRPVSLAAAADFVAKVEERRLADVGPDSSTLIVVGEQQTADVFKVAIRERRAHENARTISLDNLRFLRSLCTASVVDHRAALALLSPAADVDVGELLSIVRSAAATSDADLDDNV